MMMMDRQVGHDQALATPAPDLEAHVDLLEPGGRVLHVEAADLAEEIAADQEHEARHGMRLLDRLLADPALVRARAPACAARTDLARPRRRHEHLVQALDRALADLHVVVDEAQRLALGELRAHVPGPRHAYVDAVDAKLVDAAVRLDELAQLRVRPVAHDDGLARKAHVSRQVAQHVVQRVAPQEEAAEVLRPLQVKHGNDEAHLNHSRLRYLHSDQALARSQTWGASAPRSRRTASAASSRRSWVQSRPL